MIKAIFFDVDGTLLSFKTHRVPDDTRRALELAAANGIKLFVATGRHPAEAERVLKGYPFHGFVALNGQYCYANGETIRKVAICGDDLTALVHRLSHNPYPCEFVEEHRTYLNMVNDTVRESHAMVDLPVPPLDDMKDLSSREIFQIMAFIDVSREVEEMAFLPNCETTRWNPRFADIIPRGGSKRAGVSAMLSHFGLTPEEAMAFGDGENDISMLQYVRTGIAMGNSSQTVKDAAADVTEDVDEGGVYLAMKRYGIF